MWDCSRSGHTEIQGNAEWNGYGRVRGKNRRKGCVMRQLRRVQQLHTDATACLLRATDGTGWCSCRGASYHKTKSPVPSTIWPWSDRLSHEGCGEPGGGWLPHSTQHVNNPRTVAQASARIPPHSCSSHRSWSCTSTSANGASKGQVWTRRCAPAAPAFTRLSLPSRFCSCATGH